MQIEADPAPPIRAQAPAVRAATNADHEQISLLVSERGVGRLDSDFDLENMEAHYSAPVGVLLVTVTDGRVTAIGGYRQLDHESVELTRLRVAQAHRQNGQGRHLLRQLIDSARGEGYKQMVAEFDHEMGEARCLVGSEGFDLRRKSEFADTTLYFYKKLL